MDKESDYKVKERLATVLQHDDYWINRQNRYRAVQASPARRESIVAAGKFTTVSTELSGAGDLKTKRETAAGTSSDKTPISRRARASARQCPAL